MIYVWYHNFSMPHRSLSGINKLLLSVYVEEYVAILAE